MSTLETRTTDDGYEVTIYADDCPESPRDWGWPGTLVCFEHRRYNLGDEQVYGPDELEDRIAEEPTRVVLPLYFYEHSGVAMSTGSFIGRAHHAEWDSAMCGAVFMTDAEVRKEYGVKRITKATIAKAEANLKQQVEVYSMYLNGEVYGYNVETEDGTFVDGCGGYYGYEEVETAVEEALTEVRESGTDSFGNPVVNHA